MTLIMHIVCIHVGKGNCKFIVVLTFHEMKVWRKDWCNHWSITSGQRNTTDEATSTAAVEDANGVGDENYLVGEKLYTLEKCGYQVIVLN